MEDGEIDKGFSDSELADIMDEIESLEGDVGDTGKKSPEAEKDVESVIEASPKTNPQPEKVLPIERTKNSSSNNEVKESPVQNQPKSNNTSSQSSTTMDFNVTGDMKMHFNFYVNGQTVELNLDGENGFEIVMDGGAKFSVPLSGGVKKAG